jgi:hypothetical protein
MGWLPSIVVLVVGVVLLVVLAVRLRRALVPARAAADAFGVATQGRTMRIRAAMTELALSRTVRRAARQPGPDA